MRIVYLDEAGVSNPKHEPWLIVAGVIVNADKQCKAVEDHLLGLVDRYVPSQHRDGFSFHAKELVNGGKVFSRDKFSFSKRMEILKEICSIPRKFDLPIVYGSLEREPFAKELKSNNQREITILAQTAASLACAMLTENYMRALPDENEVALLIYEDSSECRSLIRNTHNYLRGKFKPKEDVPHILPSNSIFKRIIEAPTFAVKSDSSLLQIADACAYALKRAAMEAEGWTELWGLIRDQAVKGGSPSTEQMISDLYDHGIGNRQQ